MWAPGNRNDGVGGQGFFSQLISNIHVADQQNHPIFTTSPQRYLKKIPILVPMLAVNENWYPIKNIAQLDTPALVIYPDRVKENIRRLIAMVPSIELLRPHVKTNKSADAVRLMMDQGITKFKCATIAEAEMLGICGAKDILLAYQPNGPKLERFIKLIQTYPASKFSCLTDNLESASEIAAAAIKNHLTIAVYIDLNAGMNRTGIDPDKALALYMDLSSMPGLSLLGLHVYDGHIKAPDFAERAAHCQRAFEPIEQLREKIAQADFPFPLLIAGGSPTFKLHLNRRNVECGPGAFIFWDKSYFDDIPEQDFLWAALVVTRVVSLPNQARICLDMGYKAVSCENDLQNRVFFINAPHLQAAGHSEEHMTVEPGPGHPYKIGDVFYTVPVHICPTVSMYNEAFTVTDQFLEGSWPITARARKITI